MSSLASFAVGLFASHALSPEALGGYALVFSIFMAATVVPAQLVYVPAEVRVMALPVPLRLAVWRETLIGGLKTACVTALVVVVWVPLAPSDVPREVLAALTLPALATAAASPVQDHVRRMLHLAEASWAAATMSAVHLGVVLLCLIYATVTHSLTTWAPFGALALANAVSLLVGVLLVRQLSHNSGTLPAGLPFVEGPSGKWLLLSGLLPMMAGFLAASIVGRLTNAATIGYAEAARVVAQPILVLATGLMAVSGPRSTVAARNNDRAGALAVSRGYRRNLWMCAVPYAILVFRQTDWNLLARVLPHAYAIPGLALLMLLANLLYAVRFPERMEVIGAARERSLVVTEAVGAVLRVAVAGFARQVGAYTLPAGLLVVGVVRYVGCAVALRTHYRGTRVG